MENCNSNYDALDHFIGINKMVNIGSNTKRKIQEYKLSRYACYLIVLNCDPRKKVIALSKTYFAIQTRKQELNEKEYNELSEDEKRLYRRNKARKGNYNLNQTAVKSGVKDLARFHNARYKGLYNGETEVGKEVRNSIKRLGRTMPENLPTQNRSLKELEKEKKQLSCNNFL